MLYRLRNGSGTLHSYTVDASYLKGVYFDLGNTCSVVRHPLIVVKLFNMSMNDFFPDILRLYFRGRSSNVSAGSQ